MKAIPFLFLLLLLAACSKEDQNPTAKLPACIQDILDDPEQSENLLTIRLQQVNGENHYWLNTGAMAWDGTETIVNEQCETVCTLCGFCISPECIGDYDNEDWEIIWEK